jgi:hypothetical protein
MGLVRRGTVLIRSRILYYVACSRCHYHSIFPRLRLGRTQTGAFLSLFRQNSNIGGKTCGAEGKSHKICIGWCTLNWNADLGFHGVSETLENSLRPALTMHIQNRLRPPLVDSSWFQCQKLLLRQRSTKILPNCDLWSLGTNIDKGNFNGNNTTVNDVISPAYHTHRNGNCLLIRDQSTDAICMMFMPLARRLVGRSSVTQTHGGSLRPAL